MSGIDSREYRHSRKAHLVESCPSLISRGPKSEFMPREAGENIYEKLSAPTAGVVEQ